MAYEAERVRRRDDSWLAQLYTFASDQIFHGDLRRLGELADLLAERGKYSRKDCPREILRQIDALDQAYRAAIKRGWSNPHRQKRRAA